MLPLLKINNGEIMLKGNSQEVNEINVIDYDYVEGDKKQTALNFLKSKRIFDLFILKRQDDSVDFNEIKIPGHTDVLMEAISTGNRFHIEYVLNTGFKLKGGEFNYLNQVLLLKNEVIINLILDAVEKEGCIEMINRKDIFSGNTPLHIVIENGLSAEILCRLLRLGADLNIENNLEIIPLYLLFFNRNYLTKVMSEELVGYLCQEKVLNDITRLSKVNFNLLKLVVKDIGSNWSHDKSYFDFMKKIQELE